MAATATDATGMDVDDADELNTNEGECMICFVSTSTSELANLECDHVICLECMKMGLKTRIKDKDVLKLNVCLSGDCDRDLSDKAIRSLLEDSEGLLREYEKLRKAKEDMNAPFDDSDAEMTDASTPPLEEEKSDVEGEQANVDWEAQGLNAPPKLTLQAKKIMKARRTETAGDRHFAEWYTLKNVSQAKLRRYHFDWWMFPWCEDAMTRPGFWVRINDVISLVHHVEFQERYIRGLKTLVKLKREKDIDIVMSSNDWWIHPSRKSKVYASMDMFLFVSYLLLIRLHDNDDANRVLIANILKFRHQLIETFHELVPLFGMDEIEEELDDWSKLNRILCFSDIREFRKFRQVTKRDRREHDKTNIGQYAERLPYRTSLDARPNAIDDDDAGDDVETTPEETQEPARDVEHAPREEEKETPIHENVDEEKKISVNVPDSLPGEERERGEDGEQYLGPESVQNGSDAVVIEDRNDLEAKMDNVD